MAKTRGPSCHSERRAAVVVRRSARLARKGGRHSQQQLQMSPGSCELPPTQATIMQSIWLAPESVPLVGQSFLVLTAVLYSIHAFSTLLVLLAFSCCSPCFLSMSLASEASSLSAFSSPLSSVQTPPSFSSSSQVFPSSIPILYPSSPPVPQLKLVYFPYF